MVLLQALDVLDHLRVATGLHGRKDQPLLFGMVLVGGAGKEI